MTTSAHSFRSALVLGTMAAVLAGCGSADSDETATSEQAFCQAFTTAPSTAKPADVPARWMEGVRAAGLPDDAPAELQRGLDLWAELYKNPGTIPAGMTSSDRRTMLDFQQYAVAKCGRPALQIERSGP